MLIDTLVQAAFDALPRKIRRSIYAVLIAAILVGLIVLLLKAT